MDGELIQKLVEIAGLPENVFELLERLKGLEKRGPKNERACWLDGEECPYGKPEGQFLKRPLAFCKPGVEGKYKGCAKLNDNLEEFDNLTSQELIVDMSEKVEKATTKVSKELYALADSAENDKVKQVLKLASSLIEKEEDGLEDREIVLLEDLEIE